jgi:hypothetical protein
LSLSAGSKPGDPWRVREAEVREEGFGEVSG